MHTVRIPKVINFGEDALGQTEYPKNALVVTTVPPELSDKWLAKMGIQDYMLYDKVKPEPSLTVGSVPKAMRAPTARLQPLSPFPSAL